MPLAVFIILVIVICYVYAQYKQHGNLPFWKLAGKYPNMAYEIFKCENEAWLVLDRSSPVNSGTVPKDEWVGPFFIVVPKLGNELVRIYGRKGKYEASQEIMMKVLQAKSIMDGG